jgi:hypothetical protein
MGMGFADRQHRQCGAVKNGRRCLLVAHPENVPHCTVGAKGWDYWGGKCAACGKPAELAHEACGSTTGVRS